MARAADWGVLSNGLRVDLGQVVDRKDDVVESIRAGSCRAVDANGDLDLIALGTSTVRAHILLSMVYRRSLDREGRTAPFPGAVRGEDSVVFLDDGAADGESDAAAAGVAAGGMSAGETLEDVR